MASQSQSQFSQFEADELDEADTLRILVATDTHVGFLDRDAVRSDDSFRTFEEILQIAKDERVDCILHAGDLFHHNKPSRQTMFRTEGLLRKYCFGDRPVELELCTDPKNNFTHENVNYMDPNLNVEIPIFAIHGNHDDPAGDGALSPIDLLAQAGLLNYFGKHPQVDQLLVRPVVLKKKNTMLALYGLGNVRDERLHRMFNEKRVVMQQPKVDDIDELFSILLIHQNRAQHSAKAHVTERMLPEFLDLVVWGHEHECLVEPKPGAERDFFVTQPGSSVATSLVEGECKSKHIAIIDVNRGRFLLRPVPLQTVRPFVIDECDLASMTFKTMDEMQKFLANKVTEMIESARVNANAKNQDMLPLVRLKVDLGPAQDKISAQRFGSEFVGKVANPDDILLYSKKRATAAKGDKVTEAQLQAARAQEVAGAKQTVEFEVARILSSKAKKMSVLPEKHLALALQGYVDKEDNKAFESFVQDAIAKTKDFILKRLRDAGGAEVSVDVVKAYAEERVKDENAKAGADAYGDLVQPADGRIDDEAVAVKAEANADEADAAQDSIAVVASKRKGKAAPASAPAAKKKAAAKPAAGAKRGRKKADDDEDDDDDHDEDDFVADDEDEDVGGGDDGKEDDEEQPKASRSKRGRPVKKEPAASPAKKKAPVAPSPAKRRAAAPASVIDDEELTRALPFSRKK